MKDITYVILSPEEINPEQYEGLTYVNHVKKFDNSGCLHRERLAAIEKVQTPFFTYLDSDDPVPTGVRAPKEAGILYGTDFVRTHHIDGSIEETVRLPMPFTWLRGINNHLMIHKAICHTEWSKQISSELPEGVYNTELLLFSILAKWKGYEIDQSFIYTWEQRKTGCHNWPDVIEGIRNSTKWLFSNGHMTIKKLNELYG